MRLWASTGTRKCVLCPVWHSTGLWVHQGISQHALAAGLQELIRRRRQPPAAVRHVYSNFDWLGLFFGRQQYQPTPLSTARLQVVRYRHVDCFFSLHADHRSVFTYKFSFSKWRDENLGFGPFQIFLQETNKTIVFPIQFYKRSKQRNRLDHWIRKSETTRPLLSTSNDVLFFKWRENVAFRLFQPFLHWTNDTIISAMKFCKRWKQVIMLEQ
jgi:hypothetical protein